MKITVKYNFFKWGMQRCLSLLVLILAQVVLSGAYAQTTGLTIQQKNITVKEVLTLIEKSSQTVFFYSDKDVDLNRKVTIDVKDKSVSQVLDEVFKNSSNSFKMDGNQVYISKKPKSTEKTKQITKSSQISGAVTDEKNQAVIGANVIVNGTTKGTITDLNGHFSLEAPENGQLKISYIGFEPKLVAINNQTELNITLREDAKLEEVVVVGYGSVQKKDLTSSVSTVRSKDFLQGAVNSPLQMIDGKVAGVTISNPAAADPNRSTDVQVRGASSLQAGNGPLIVIDGMAGGDLRNITQQDIESITVLKDASSAAIYGSRGANGVILVTTKRGTSGNVVVTYDSYLERDYVANKPDILSPEDFLTHKRDIDYGGRTNWYDQLLRKDNFGQNHFLSVSGGSANTQFRISGNYKEKSGIDIASDREEYGFRANFLQKAMGGILELGGNISYRVANEKYTNYGAFQQAVKLNPTYSIMDATNPSKYNTIQGFDTYNPVQDLLTSDKGADQTYSIVDFTAKLNISKNLNTELKVARQGHNALSHEYYNSLSAESVNNNRTGRARLQNENWTDYTLEWLGNYATKIDKHDLKFVGGYSYQEFNNQGFWAENMNFPSDAFTYNNLDAGSWNNESGRLGMDSWKSKEKTIAFLGRGNYSYDDTYFLTASFRYEGNTKFGVNNKWGLFPAVSAAWRISKLPFIADIKAIDDLKIRASYGETGRSGFPRYTSLSRYQGYGRYKNDDGQWIQVYGPANNFNADLKWEKAISYNLGVDFTLFNNKLSGSVDLFNRKSTNLLSNYDVPVGSYVQEQIFVNVGGTSSKGIEIALNWNAVRTADFSYSTNFTGSYTKSKLDSWSNDKYHSAYMDLQNLPSPGNPGPGYRLENNVELGSFFGYKYAGVDDAGKILIWKNGKEGTEKIVASSQADSNRDRTYIGHGTPRFELSWGNTVTYKNFDLSLFFRGRFDYKILNLYQMYYGLVAEPGVNLLKDAYTRNGAITSGKVVCDYFLENGNYLKLDNITLGWSPKVHVKYISNVRLYGTVKNVFTITKFSGLDPTSVGVTGLTPGYGDLNVYPIARNVSVGLQITF